MLSAERPGFLVIRIAACVGAFVLGARSRGPILLPGGRPKTVGFPENPMRRVSGRTGI